MRWYRASGVFRVQVVILSATMLAACSGSSKGNETGAWPGKVDLPTVGPSTPFPPLSAAAFAALAADLPELATRRDAVLAAESEAINRAIEQLRAKQTNSTPASPQNVAAASAAHVRMVRAGTFSLFPVAFAADMDLSFLGPLQQYVAGHQIAAMVGDGPGGSPQKDGQKTVPISDGSASGSVSVSVTNGVPAAEVASSVTLPTFGMNANSKVRMSGDLCPGPDGRVELTATLASGGRAGSGGSSIYDHTVEAKVTVTVGDDAEMTGANFDLKQSTRSTAGGRQVYVESSQSATMKGRRDDSNTTFGDAKLIRASSQATSADSALAADGLAQAYYVALGALDAAREHWQGGKCLEIDAASPGTVEPGATSRIPVAVKHTRDNSSVPAKVDVRLTGGASVSPATIAKAPGDVTHVAVNERQKSMTIALTATSRRGKAMKELVLSTGGRAYTATGGGQGLAITGRIEDLSKPFTLQGQGQGFSIVLSYTPSSESAGAMSYNGQGGGMAMTGKGPYTIADAGSGAGGRRVLTLTADPTGCVTGGGFQNCRTTHEVVTLTPAD